MHIPFALALLGVLHGREARKGLEERGRPADVGASTTFRSVRITW